MFTWKMQNRNLREPEIGNSLGECHHGSVSELPGQIEGAARNFLRKRPELVERDDKSPSQF